MKIDILQEVTDWSKEGCSIKNGIYHVNANGHLVQFNDMVFNPPLKKFSKTGRKFVKVGTRIETE